MISNIVEMPATGEEFFDREHELELVLDNIKKNEHMVIVGHRKVGKTSILFRIGELLTKKNYFFVYTYIPESSNVELLAQEFLISILRSLADIPIITNVDGAVQEIAKKYPEVTSTVLDLIRIPRNEIIFRDALILLDEILKKLNRRAVLVLDEFQNIANASLAILDYIRQAMWKIERTTIILCGSMIRMIEKILSRASMPQGLRRIKIEPFDFPTTREFIVKSSRKTIPEYIIAFIYAITGGMPFHIKVLMKELNNLQIEKVSWWAARKILLEELMNDSGVLYNYYSAIETKLESLSTMYMEILYAIATGNRKISEIARFLNKKPQDLNYYIKRLREMEIIDEDNVIVDEMFELWLKTAWPILRKTPIPEINRRRKIFLQAVGEIIEKYKSLLGQTAEFIIYELVKKMRGEKISGEKMPNPKQVLRNVTIDDKEIDILATRNNEAWIIEVRTSPVTKDDIEELEKKSKCLKGYKVKHKILVALSTISHEALQRALQLRITIWTRHKIRKLLRYYRIPISPVFF